MSISKKVKALFGLNVPEQHVREAPPPEPRDFSEYAHVPKVSVWPLNPQEWVIMFRGKQVGYCGRKPNMPVNFLRDDVTRLTLHEKAEIVTWLMAAGVQPKATAQLRPVLEFMKHERLDIR